MFLDHGADKDSFAVKEFLFHSFASMCAQRFEPFNRLVKHLFTGGSPFTLAGWPLPGIANDKVVISFPAQGKKDSYKLATKGRTCID